MESFRLRMARRPDIAGRGVVLVGDRFDADFEDQQRLQAAEILQILHRPQAAVPYIMGNDDNLVLEHADEPIRPLHGRRIEIGDYNLAISTLRRS
jgi:hypothetical protein